MHIRGRIMKLTNHAALTILVTTFLSGCNANDPSGDLIRLGQNGNKQVLCEGADPNYYGFFGGGSGTKENPFLICTVDHYKAMGTDGSAGKYYKLTTDLDFSGETDFQRIALIDSFDGNNHKFKNITMRSQPGVGGIALFGQFASNLVGGRGELRNLVVENVKIEGGTRCEPAAVIALANWNGLISNVHVTGAIDMKSSSCKEGELYAEVGGLVGENASDIENASFEGSINGPTTVGGIAAINTGRILNSHTAGEFKGSSGVGGLIGVQVRPGAVAGSSSNSSSIANSHFGRFIGYDCSQDRTDLCQHDLTRH